MPKVMRNTLWRNGILVLCFPIISFLLLARYLEFNDLQPLIGVSIISNTANTSVDTTLTNFHAPASNAASTYTAAVVDVRITLPLTQSAYVGAFFHVWDCVMGSLWDAYSDNQWVDLDKEKIIFQLAQKDVSLAQKHPHLLELLNDTFVAEIISHIQMAPNQTVTPPKPCRIRNGFDYTDIQFVRFSNEFRYFLAKQWNVSNMVTQTQMIRLSNGSDKLFVNEMKRINLNFHRHRSSKYVQILFDSNETVIGNAASQLIKNVVIVTRTNNRIIYNLKEFIAGLKAIFGSDSHFTVVNPIGMHLWEINRFASNASVVIITHSGSEAGLLNLVPNETPVIEISPWYIHCSCFRNSPRFYGVRNPQINFHSYGLVLTNTTCVDICKRYPSYFSYFKHKKYIFVDAKAMAKLISAIDYDLRNTNETSQLSSFQIETSSLYVNNSKPY